MRRFGFLVFSWLLLLGLASEAFAQDDAAPAPPAPAGRRGISARRRAAELRAAAAQNAQAAATPTPAVPAPLAPPFAPASPAAAPTPATGQEREPPGAVGPLPANMDKISQATDVPFKAMPPGHLVKFNLQDADLAELVNHISGLTGKRFIYGAKVRQVKATVVSPEPITLEEAYQAFLSILEANGMTVVPHGRFLKIVDSGGVVGVATPLYARGEPVPDSDRYVTRLYRLENVSPDEVIPILSKFKSKEGDLSSYNPGRLLIITDTATQVQRLIRIIEEIDVGGAGQHMWIEPVRNGQAQDMAKRMNELFELGTPAPGQPPNAKSGGLSRVIADDASNNLIVVGTEDSYLRLLELLKRLDARPEENGGRVRVLSLQHAMAEELSKTLNEMLNQGNKQQNQPGAQNSGMFEGDVRITADKPTNSLLINSSNRDYATLRLVIDKLDRSRRQVFIEAVIMDLSVSDQLTLGVSFHGGDTIGGANQSLLLGGFKAGQSIGFPTDPSLLQGFAAGVRGPPLSGTQSLLGTGLSVPAFGVVLSALASSGKSNVLATPHIIATDNVSAEISIGDNIPLQTNVGGGLASLAGAAGATAANPLAALGGLGAFGGGFAAPRQDVGNKIKVTPHINESNQVRLEIDQESSSPGAAVGALGAVPIQKRTAITTVVVQDQQTVVIGGLMRDEYTTSREKIPLLGDLPLLGALFRSNTTTKRKANLLLILTPHVIRDQADLRRIFERKMQERQEFLDRYFVFSGQDWTPPKDWSRTSGLVEDIRKAYREIEEQQRLEAESHPATREEREPSEPIELPGDVRSTGGAGADGAAPRARVRRQPAPAGAAPAARSPAPQSPPAVPPPPPAAPPAPQGSNDAPFRVNPQMRSVALERLE